MPPRTTDMTPAELKYALSQKGYSYSDVDRRFGLTINTAVTAAKGPHPAGEVAIAAILCLPPKDIWPSRYNTKGVRLKPQPARNYTRKPAIAKPKEGAAA